jgi:POT family proton-dependent oligopeptide transporter
MSSGAALDTVVAARADFPAMAKGMKDETVLEKHDALTSSSEEFIGPNGEQYPTPEEWKTLPRVYGKVDYMIYVIGIVEMCERFAYYGTTAVCKCLRCSYGLETALILHCVLVVAMA